MAMEQTEKIKQAVTDFVKGGDTSNIELLDAVLHKEFRVTSNAFMGTQGITIIDKQTYLKNIKEGTFGGLSRSMNIELVDVSGSIAMVKLRLESPENYFVSYNALVADANGNWQLISNHAVVTAKNA